ncbi:hypothetical protein V8F20_008625, partial [Naviculisporaceae sp. PSN 640]
KQPLLQVRPLGRSFSPSLLSFFFGHWRIRHQSFNHSTMNNNDIEMDDTESQDDNITQLNSFQDLSIVENAGDITPQVAAQVATLINDGRGPRLPREERRGLSTLADNADSTESLVLAAAAQRGTPLGEALVLSSILRTNNEVQETWNDLQKTITDLEDATRDIRSLDHDVVENMRSAEGDIHAARRDAYFEKKRHEKTIQAIIRVIGNALGDTIRAELIAAVGEVDKEIEAEQDAHFEKLKEQAAAYREQNGGDMSD